MTALAGAASAADRPVALWRQGANRLVVQGEGEQTAILILGGKTVWKGDGLAGAKVLWNDPKRRDPALVFAAVDDGNGGTGKIVTVDLSSKPKVNVLPVDEVESVQVRMKDGAPAFDEPFQIQYFRNGAHYNAGYATLPVIWQAGHYVLDFKAVNDKAWSGRDLAALRQVVSRDVREGLAKPADRQDFGDVAQVLVPLLIYGHADQARVILDAAWPASAPGEEAFWNDLCAAVARQPLWHSLNMHCIPHAAVVETAAAKGRPSA